MIKEDPALVESTPPERASLEVFQEAFDMMVEDSVTGSTSFDSTQFRADFVEQFRNLANGTEGTVTPGGLTFFETAEWITKTFEGDYTPGKIAQKKEIAAQKKQEQKEARAAEQKVEEERKAEEWAVKRAEEEKAREAEAGILDDMDFYGDEDGADEPAAEEPKPEPKKEEKPVE